MTNDPHTNQSVRGRLSCHLFVCIFIIVYFIFVADPQQVEKKTSEVNKQNISHLLFIVIMYIAVVTFLLLLLLLLLFILFVANSCSKVSCFSWKRGVLCSL